MKQRCGYCSACDKTIFGLGNVSQTFDGFVSVFKLTVALWILAKPELVEDNRVLFHAINLGLDLQGVNIDIQLNLYSPVISHH